MPEARKREKSGAKSGSGFTEEERAAMKEALRERRASMRSGTTDGEQEVRAKIAAMPPADRVLADRFHGLIRKHAPTLACRTCYGMPAYTKDGEVLCFFQSAQKFKTRYATLGFSDEAKLDDGRMWPTAFALTGLGDEETKRIVALLQNAVG